MKALVLKEYKRFAYEEVPQPEPGPGEVLIKVKACGICGSDVHGMDGSTGRRIPPIVMGHEAAGTIESLGPGVQGWQTGERVTFDSTVYCGSCWHCRRGEINLCDNRRVLGVSCDEYRRDGAFAEYVAVPQHILYRIPEGVGYEQAAMVEAVSIAAHGVNRLSPRLGDAVVVVGAGIIGLLVVQVLKAAGCGLVAAVDVAAERLEMARRLGADVGLDPTREEVASRVRELTGGRGADGAVEAVGSTAAVQTAVAAVRKGATLALIGNVSPSVEFPLQSVVTREISVNGSCASRGEYPAAIDMIARRRIDVDALISATAPLREGAEWFRRLYEREKGLIKVVLVP
ncbi:MAG: galactitol-1-phosphate 5-dehydrogenase [Spirochaetales bacterium]|nr:galactitol-1-phosphate 5-dehydrogenase [Spirochaetales bacterium]